MTIVCARCDATATGTPDKLPEGWESQSSGMTGATFLVCGSCCSKAEDRPRPCADAASEQLRLLIERVERLEEEERGIKDDKKDVYGEAKAIGFDVKVMREIIRRRRMTGDSLREFTGLLETYEAALGMT